ncbi:GNAT family N-acetyltransferase [Nocardioides palaemonis]|uniref:GNAT family N-acetyltransferase n=1 Tax=Nocardioides palaemonis TaxID=2829810 RepID=UPI0027DD7620|nr:GNAT family N-acetyltransferase [Nocardioides palaemonis]
MTTLVVHTGAHDLAGSVDDGESWRAAAARTVAAVGGAPVARDLSGAVLHFDLDPEHVVSLRAMTRDDLPLMTRWRASDAVRRWWEQGREQTPEQIHDMYAERVDGRSPTRMWVVEVDARPAGFVQDYRISDYPDHAVLVPDPGAVGVDYAIGEDAWRGRGLGAAVLWSWAEHARSRYPDVTTYFAAPDYRNTASLRVLAKAGFEPGTWFDQPQADGSTHTVVGCSLDVRRVLA